MVSGPAVLTLKFLKVSGRRGATEEAALNRSGLSCKAERTMTYFLIYR